MTAEPMLLRSRGLLPCLAAEGPGKSEVRSSKSEGSPKFEVRSSKEVGWSKSVFDYCRSRRKEALIKVRTLNNRGNMSLLVGVLPNSSAPRKVGRVSPSAPSAVAQTQTFRSVSAPRGALGETRPTTARLGQHGLPGGTGMGDGRAKGEDRGEKC